MKGTAMTDDPEYLFEIPGSDRYELTIKTALLDWSGEPDETVTMNVYSVHPPTSHIMSAEAIVDEVLEDVCENGEIVDEVTDGWNDAAEDPEVTAAAEHLRQVLASKVHSRMADEHIDTIVGTPAALRAITYQPKA